MIKITKRIEDKTAAIIKLIEKPEYTLIYEVKIAKSFKGKGLFKIMMLESLQSGINTLATDNRNFTSNAIFEKWTGKKLKLNQLVLITLEGEFLKFKAI